MRLYLGFTFPSSPSVSLCVLRREITSLTRSYLCFEAQARAYQLFLFGSVVELRVSLPVLANASLGSLPCSFYQPATFWVLLGQNLHVTLPSGEEAVDVSPASSCG